MGRIARTTSSLLTTLRKLPLWLKLTAPFVLIGLIGLIILASKPAPESEVFIPEPTNESSTEEVVLPKGTPSYKTILPAGRTISYYGGWTRVSPEGRNTVYAYPDSIDGVPVSVSQQPIPDNFQDAPAESVKDLAASFQANEKITADNTTVYLSTLNNGSQMIIFTKDDVLVFIRSEQVVTNQSWVAYINSLE